MLDGLNHEFHEGGHDAITRELDIEHRATAINASLGYLGAIDVGFVRNGRDIVNERTYERTFENLSFVIDEDLNTFVLEFADDTGTQVLYLLVGVGELFFADAFQNSIFAVFIKE